MRARLASAAAAVTAVALTGVVPAGAASVSAVGWWSSRPGASAPDGGLFVGSGLQGPTAVAAVRIDLGDGVRSARLELTEAGGVAEGTAALAVCVTGNLWEAGGGGPMEEAPTTSCTGAAVAPTRVEGTWSADVLSLVEGRKGTVSLAVVPASTQGLWELQFEPPVLTATPAPEERATTTTTVGAGSVAGARPAATPTAGSSSFAAPGPPAVPVPPTTAPTAAGGETVDPAAQTTTGPADGGDTAEQAAAFEPLAAGAAAADDGTTAGKVLLFAAVAAGVGIVGGLGRKYATGS